MPKGTLMTKELQRVLFIAASKFVVGQLTGEEMPELAVSVLEEGVENDEIIELSGLHKPLFSDAKQLFYDGISKTGLKFPDIKHATMYLAGEISGKILNGLITPYEGARKIWWGLSYIEGADERLRAFVGLASEYEDSFDTNTRSDYERQILEEAKKIIRECGDVFLVGESGSLENQ